MLRERDGGKGENRRGHFNGHWFIGEDHNHEYFQTSFWTDRDNTRRVYAIALTFTATGKQYLEISWKQNKEYENIALNLIHKKYDFFKTENIDKGLWFVFDKAYQFESFIDTVYDIVSGDIDQLLDELNISNPRVSFQDCESMIYKVGEHRITSKRLARVCWNARGWVVPSGWEGKSEDERSYEYETGFGHEEWLANSMFDLDGFRYTHLQPFKEVKEEKVGILEFVTLYSRNNEDGLWYWIGSIKEPELITTEESEQITSIFHEKGWVKIMQKQVNAVGAQWKDMPHVCTYSLFNLKFNPINLAILDSPVPVSDIERRRFIRMGRYVPTVNRFGYDPVAQINTKQLFGTPLGSIYSTLAAGSNLPRPEGSYSKLIPSQDIQIERNHNRAQNLIEKYLSSQEMKNILFEYQSIDICCITRKGKFLLIEVKTHEQPRYAIRYAIGQLLEYSGWKPESRSTNTLLAIATTVDLDEQSFDYLNSLKERYGLEVGHLYVDLKTDTVIPRIIIW